ncbi:MAG: nucleotide-binding protein [Methanolinea sp.]|jgi:replication factor A1|nr:nucleotide-binding protein [Methanolinea sp.]
MDFSDTAERISQKITSRGHTVEKSGIETKLRRLVDEFGVPPAEAERTVLNELAREFSLTGFQSGGAGEQKTLNQLMNGEWVTVECKVVALTAAPSPSIAQTGIMADVSAAMRFVVWSRANAPVLEAGKWYRLESAVVDQYKGMLNLKIHSGTTVREVPHEGSLKPDITPIRDLSPGVASVRGKVVQEWEATHDRILQSGLIADETGSVRFVLWKEEGKERLNPGGVYTLYYATVDDFNGRLSITLNTATTVPEEGDIQVNTGSSSFQGAFVHLAPGSGLIKRCPVEGCNRVLSRQNYCPVHEIQPQFQYDLRIKGWLDNGEETREILIQRGESEHLVGMNLDQARELAENNPLGMDEVFLRFREALLGRYLSCRGREIENRLLVSGCELLHYEPEQLANLLNRAGGSL